jgi:glyoxylase-like metal-dependent hydrolase (beta-lactamase superfamily II)
MNTAADDTGLPAERTSEIMHLFSSKKMIFVVLAVIISVTLGAYIYYSDHRSLRQLPASIIPIDQGITVAYLVKLPQGHLLFDTGYASDYASFASAITKKNISISDIRYCLLSHHHDDHAGYINTLLKNNSNIKVIAHERSVPLLASGKNNTANGGGIVNSRIYALFRFKQIITPEWDLSFPPFTMRTSDILLKETAMNLPSDTGRNLKVLYTPGHTNDSISLIVDDTYLLCGDLASNFLNWAGASQLTLFNENVVQVYRSWLMVYGEGIKVIVPSHGKPFSADLLKENFDIYKQEELVKFF